MPREFTADELMASDAIEAANRLAAPEERAKPRRPAPEEIRKARDIALSDDMSESDLRYVRFISACLLLAVAEEELAQEVEWRNHE